MKLDMISVVYKIFKILSSIIVLLAYTASCSSPDIKGTWVSSNGIMELVVTEDTMNFGINRLNPIFNNSQDTQIMNMYNNYVKDIKPAKYSFIGSNKIKISGLASGNPDDIEITNVRIQGTQLTFYGDNSILADPSFNPWLKSK